MIIIEMGLILVMEELQRIMKMIILEMMVMLTPIVKVLRKGHIGEDFLKNWIGKDIRYKEGLNAVTLYGANH